MGGRGSVQPKSIKPSPLLRLKLNTINPGHPGQETESILSPEEQAELQDILSKSTMKSPLYGVYNVPLSNVRQWTVPGMRFRLPGIDTTSEETDTAETISRAAGQRGGKGHSTTAAARVRLKIAGAKPGFASFQGRTFNRNGTILEVVSARQLRGGIWSVTTKVANEQGIESE